MKKEIENALCWILVLIFITGCAIEVAPEVKSILVFDIFKTREEKIRYILADMQLMGDTRFYYEFMRNRNDIRASIVEAAIARWEMGVRVVNIERFFIKTRIGKISFNNKSVVLASAVCYLSTNQLINPKDVILTSDLVPTTAPKPIATLEPTQAPAPQPTVANATNLCDSPYWPIREGASWTYDQYNLAGPIRPQTRTKYTIKNLINQGDRTTFELDVQKISGSGGLYSHSFYCTNEGVFDARGSYMLPFNQTFVARQEYGANGHVTMVSSIKQENVPAGNFNVVTLCMNPGDRWIFCNSFSVGIGPVVSMWYDAQEFGKLVEYYIP
jgi:hypothetical protein